MCAFAGSRLVMAGLGPAIHVFGYREKGKTWMPATSAGMTTRKDESPPFCFTAADKLPTIPMPPSHGE
jgi:hypothetical protein